jgi:hypothetical protein
MAKLWISNSSKQNHEFVYRPKVGDGGVKDGILRPMYGDLRKQLIPVGGQICIGDLGDQETKDILAQHRHIVEFKDLLRERGFQGLCYRIGPDPMPIDKIMERISLNDEVRKKEATERQSDTALEIATNMRTVAASDDAPFKDLRETDVQVAQKGAKDVNGGTPELNQVVEVTEEGKSPSGRGRKSAS